MIIFPFTNEYNMVIVHPSTLFSCLTECLPTPGVFGIGRKEGSRIGGVVVLESGEDWFHIFDGFAFAS